jgi:hypothetical protein
MFKKLLLVIVATLLGLNLAVSVGAPPGPNDGHWGKSYSLTQQALSEAKMCGGPCNPKRQAVIDALNGVLQVYER